MTRQTPELFSQPPVRSDFSHHRIEGGGRRWIVLAMPVLLVLVLVFAYMQFSSDESAPVEVPTIAADGVAKERPEQPGGVEIPHQDMLVFQQIEKGSGEDNAQVEHLLPPPEAPQPVADVPTTVSPDTAGAAVATQVEQSAVPAAVEPVPAPASIPAPVAAVAPEPQVPAAQPATTVVSEPVVEKKKEVPKQEVAGKLPKELFLADSNKASTGGKTVVQLASVADSIVAQTEMRKLQSKYASQLGSTKLRIVKANLPKGIYYRVQSEGVSDASAKSICAALKAHNAGCIIVRP